VKGLVAELKDRMRSESDKMRFEKAARIRDIINGVEEVFGSRNRSFRYASIASAPGREAVEDLRGALRLKRFPELIEGFDISNIGGELAVASMVCFRNGCPERKSYRRFKIKDVKGIDDFAMMSEVLTRHYGRKIKEKLSMPDLIMVDGGKGQLSSAVSALSAINCPGIPVIGLAKKKEEIFLPGRSEPVVLERQRKALKLLQSIRDEAHRFAISYHRELRRKRLSESLLDEIPGIGPEKKKILLKTFGSVAAIRRLSPEDIAAGAPGIGIKFAELVSEKLKKR
jgi:excinuclease ABC subunit C